MGVTIVEARLDKPNKAKQVPNLHMVSLHEIGPGVTVFVPEYGQPGSARAGLVLGVRNEPVPIRWPYTDFGVMR